LDREDAPTDPQNEPVTPAIRPINPNLFLIPLFIVLAVLTFFLGRRYSVLERAPVFVRASFERTGLRVPSWISRWEHWSVLSPIARAFESINFSLRLLKKPAPVSSTPIERANELSRLLPQLADPIKVLLDEHQTSLYTSRTADVNSARRSALNIRTQTIVAIIRHFLTGEYAVRS
jgi:hypothetical protein